MAFLAKYRKADLKELAVEMGLEIEDGEKIVDICRKIKDSPDFDTEFCKNCLDNLVQERERERELQERERERERELQERERERERELQERERVREYEERERVRAHETQKLKITCEAETASTTSIRSEPPRTNHDFKRMMQKYDPEVTDIAIYLTLFERQARAIGVEEAEWVSHLIALLPLDIAQIILREPEESSRSYPSIKKMLLERFRMRPETFRSKFVQHQRKPGSLWKELAFDLRTYINGWIEGVEVQDYESLKNLMIADQLKRRAPTEIRDHFIDQWVNLNDPVILADKFDEYEAVRKRSTKSFVPKVPERKTYERGNLAPRKEDRDRQTTRPKENSGFWRDSHAPSGNWRKDNFEKRVAPACFICKSTDHLRPNCPQLKKNNSAERVNHLSTIESIEKKFAPHMSRALINKYELPVLRDTGSSIDLLSRNYVKPSDFTGETVWVRQPLDTNFTCLPLARVEIEHTDFGRVCTKAAIIDEALDNGFYLLGNGTADLIKCQQKIPNLNAVMTRSQRKRETETSVSADKQQESKTETMGREKKEVSSENIEREENTLALVSQQGELVGEPDLILPERKDELDSLLKVDANTFTLEQGKCPSLELCWEKQRKGHGTFELRDRLLFRKSKDHRGNYAMQLVVPLKYHSKILELCHEGTSAHLGMTKTKDRFLKFYFWPNCIKDIEEFVRSCDLCQRVGKAQEKKKAPLKLVPIIAEIFSKINIDAVGPLPLSSTNKRYLITAICMSSKYPEAIAVNDITSVSVVDALLNIFSRFGYPREVQSDLGTSFTSQLTTEFLSRFGISVSHSSVHHPESNPVERFHRTLKRLLKVLCLESGEDWEKTLPAALLALRTVTHESTGFSPAELVHGKNLRMPETLLYEHWVSPQETDPMVTEYVFDLINRLKRCQDLAIEQMTESRDKRKVWYDRNAIKRKFQIGDLVLVLATSKPNKMAVSWTGPGVIESQISETNYIVRLSGKNDKSQIYHVNLLKPYYQRPERINLMLSDDSRVSEGLEIVYPNANPNFYDFADIVNDSALSERLSPEQILQLRGILDEHREVFSNDPGKTDLVEHDIELICNKPVRSKPYRSSMRQTEILKTEIKRMLDLGIIEEGQSDYVSPMLLVEVQGKDPRPCIDYRRLNEITRHEYFPLPNIEERVEQVSSATFITVIDLAKGYWQIPLSKRAQRYSAFVTSFGTYIPLRMGFGLINAPFRFSSLMAKILIDCEKFAVPYLDDVAIFSNDWESHLQHIKIVLTRIADAKLTIKPSKCKFAQSHTKYLGHIVGGGIRTPAEAKVKAVLDFPTPKTTTQIKAFLGLTGYYSHYVKDFSVIATPLTDALRGRKKSEKIEWTTECSEAFEKLKDRLTRNPVLHAPDFSREFIVQTDASDKGLGAVLSQRDEKGIDYPILYLSKKFSDTEKRYSTTEKECASIIYAIKKLNYYLDGQFFIIQTDHNPLVWLKSNAGKNPRLLRWSLALQPYRYKVEHRPGTKNQNADSLSRIGFDD